MYTRTLTQTVMPVHGLYKFTPSVSCPLARRLIPQPAPCLGAQTTKSLARIGEE